MGFKRMAENDDDDDLDRETVLVSASSTALPDSGPKAADLIIQ
jgi:hypothetical protein